MKISQLLEEIIEEFEKKEIWLELVFEIKDGFNSLEEMLNDDNRIKRIYLDTVAIIHSKDLKDFIKKSPFKPDEILTLGDANINEQVLSVETIRDILLDNEFIDEFIEIDESYQLATEVAKRCKKVINNLPLEDIIKFESSFADDLVEKEAEVILLPYYLEYREKLKERFNEKDNKLEEKINRIKYKL